jgi:hypothetical protein
MTTTQTILRLPSPDPWRALLGRALQGHRRDALRAVRALDRCGTSSRLLAIAARTLWALDLSGPAAVMLNRAMSKGGPQARGLASVALPHPGDALLQRLSAPDASERADAACDLAWRGLRRGDMSAAERAVARALADSPHHAEARRWDRFLSLGGSRAMDLVADPNHDEVGSSVLARDALALCPHPRSGWLAPERWHRRVQGGGWSEPARAGTALARLQREGTTTRLLGTQSDYEDLPADHPLAVAERALDTALSLEREGRDTEDAAAEAWALAARVDGCAVHDAAMALVALGARCASAATTGLAAAELLLHTAPHRCIWAAYRARLLGQAGHHRLAAGEARAVLARGDLDAVSFGLAVSALRSSGLAAFAHRACVAAQSHTDLGLVADHLLTHPDRPPTPVVGNRLQARGRLAAPAGGPWLAK